MSDYVRLLNAIQRAKLRRLSHAQSTSPNIKPTIASAQSTRPNIKPTIASAQSTSPSIETHTQDEDRDISISLSIPDDDDAIIEPCEQPDISIPGDKRSEVAARKPSSLIDELLDFDTSLKSIKEWIQMKEAPPLVLLGNEHYCMAITLTNRLKTLGYKTSRFSLNDWNWRYLIRRRRINVIDNRVSDVTDYDELLEIWKQNPTFKFMILPSEYKKATIRGVASVTLTPIRESKTWDWYRWCKEMEEKELIDIRYWTVEETLRDRARRHVK